MPQGQEQARSTRCSWPSMFSQEGTVSAEHCILRRTQLTRTSIEKRRHRTVLVSAPLSTVQQQLAGCPCCPCTAAATDASSSRSAAIEGTRDTDEPKETVSSVWVIQAAVTAYVSTARLLAARKSQRTTQRSASVELQAHVACEICTRQAPDAWA